MKLKRTERKKTSLEVVLEYRLARLLRRRESETELLQLINRLPEYEFREEIRQRRIDNLAKIERDLTRLKEEIQNYDPHWAGEP